MNSTHSPRLSVIGSLCGVAHGQGGPPFRTDDPETPGNRNWEINFGWVGERSAAEGSYSIPDVDLNYGLGEPTYEDGMRKAVQFLEGFADRARSIRTPDEFRTVLDG